MYEYKGIYYGEESERKYFEGGAHFKYLHLYKILDKLSKEQKRQQEQQRTERENPDILIINVIKFLL